MAQYQVNVSVYCEVAYSELPKNRAYLYQVRALESAMNDGERYSFSKLMIDPTEKLRYNFLRMDRSESVVNGTKL